MGELVRTRAYTNIAKLRKQLRNKIKSAGIEDRALRGFPLVRRKKALNASMLRGNDGIECTDAEGKKEILTQYFRSCWSDTSKLQGEILSWVHRQ